MPSTKGNFDQTAPGTLSLWANPQPAYIPLADVAFGDPRNAIVFPQALPPQNMVFPNMAWSAQGWPSPHVIFDMRRNGVAF